MCSLIETLPISVILLDKKISFQKCETCSNAQENDAVEKQFTYCYI